MFQDDTEIMAWGITTYPRELTMIGSLYGNAALQNQHGMILQIQVDTETRLYRWILIAPDRKVTAHAVDVERYEVLVRIERLAKGM